MCENKEIELFSSVGEVLLVWLLDLDIIGRCLRNRVGGGLVDGEVDEELA